MTVKLGLSFAVWVCESVVPDVAMPCCVAGTPRGCLFDY